MTKVAIFETDHAFAVELRSELSRFGCTVQVFTDGTSGLNAARSNPPDLILVSAELPPVNGFSTCNKVKKDATLASVPVILMSSESSPETFEQHRRLPSRADDYVHKPISFADFLPHIQQLIELDVPAGIVDEDTSMVMDEELLLLDEPAFEEGPRSEPGGERRPTLELEIGGAAATRRRPMAATDDDDEEEDEELVTVVGERPHVPDHLLAQFRAARQGAAPVPAPLRATAPPLAAAPAAAVAGPPSSQPAPASDSLQPQTGPPAPTGRPGRWSSHAPAAAAPADLQRAKNALQTALAQLNQSRKDNAGLRAELALARGAESGDLERVRRELDEARRKLESLGSTSEASEREMLDLRDRLQARDKEILGLREAMAAKEREVLAAKDGSLGVERSLTELKEKLNKLETEKSAANARVEALLADKALADKRAEDFRNGARKIAEQLNQRAKELHEANEAHNAAVERLKREHQAALAKADEKRRKELAEVERTHREQIDRTVGAEKEKLGKAELTTRAKIEVAATRAREQVDRVQKEAKEQLERVRREAKEQLERAQRGAEEKLAKAHASAKSEREAALAAVSAAHGKERLELEKQLEAAHLEAEELRKLADDAKETIDEALADRYAAQEQHEQDLARVREELLAAHRDELAKLTEAHRLELATEAAQVGDSEAKVTALRHEHEEALRALQAENAEALQKAGYDYQEKILQKDKSFATLKEQLDAELSEANQEIASLKQQQVRLSDATELERREHDDHVSTIEAERDDLIDQVKQLEADGAAMNDKLAALEKKLEKARVRWGEDRAELKQVKNTLAGLVRALDETVVKDLDD